MKLPRLSTPPKAAEYRKLDGKKVRLGSRIVTVSLYRTESRLGSYERGLKWSSTEWGLLIWDHRSARNSRYRVRDYSLDHGATWHPDVRSAARSRKGRVKLGGDLTKEFAFDAIQATNRRFDPTFRWHR